VAVVFESCGRLIWRRVATPRQYPAGFRDEVVRRMLTGESVSDLVLESGMPMQTLHRWSHQALIDAGLAEGINSPQSVALRMENEPSARYETPIKLLGHFNPVIAEANGMADFCHSHKPIYLSRIFLLSKTV